MRVLSQQNNGHNIKIKFYYNFFFCKQCSSIHTFKRKRYSLVTKLYIVRNSFDSIWMCVRVHFHGLPRKLRRTEGKNANKLHLSDTLDESSACIVFSRVRGCWMAEKREENFCIACGDCDGIKRSRQMTTKEHIFKMTHGKNYIHLHSNLNMIFFF